MLLFLDFLLNVIYYLFFPLCCLYEHWYVMLRIEPAYPYWNKEMY